MKNSRILFLPLALILLFTLTSCAPEDIQFIIDMAEEWARAKNINPTNEDGSINLVGAWNAGFSVVTRAVGRSTGDAETDAALDAKEVVDSISKGDELANKGIDNRDLKPIEEAMELRPHDYHYRNAHYVVLLANGDSNAASDTWGDWLAEVSTLRDEYVYGAILRDRMGLIERTLQSSPSDSGRRLLRDRYCSDATDYLVLTGDVYYWERAKKSLGIDCAE